MVNTQEADKQEDKEDKVSDEDSNKEAESNTIKYTLISN